MKRLALLVAVALALALTAAAASAPKTLCVGGPGCYPTLAAGVAAAGTARRREPRPSTATGCRRAR